MNNNQIPYVSCIKINGGPILPPVITPELRKELQQYKEQAVKLEQCLKNSRELTKNLNELLESHNESFRPSSQLTFGDNSHIEALNISDKSKKEKPEEIENKKCNLSLDLIEITQYDDSGVTPILSNQIYKEIVYLKKSCDNEQTDSSDAEGAKNFETSRNDCHNNSTSKPQCYEFYKPATPPKPRLIRSNSYTLETPSPILLAHLQKASCFEGHNADNSGLAFARNWTSLENNHTSFESSDFSSADTVYHKETCDRSDISSSPDKSSKVINEVKSPTIEVYQTDISVQQITVNTSTNAENSLKKEEKTEKFLSKNPFDVFEPDSELLNVLKDIPEIYANEIVKLLKVQHLEQKERLERYDNLNCSPEKSVSVPEIFRSQSSSEHVRNGDAQHSSINPVTSSTELTPTIDNIVDFMSKSNENYVAPPLENNANSNRPHTTESCAYSDTLNSEKLRRSSTFSISPSQSLYYSITSDIDSLTVPASPSVKLIDLESNNDDNLEIGVLREKDDYWEGVMVHENAKSIDNFSRELFPEIDPVTMNAIKKEWAASVICAHVRGYLTRRLLKTEKVQGLIATIKDVLTCALELHHSDTIDEKDVELHRRLINQLSAALYAFHETFFDLSVPEQMLIIAVDRQRKLEKLNRPQSSKRSTSRPVSGRSTTSSKSDKSLPSSRASSKHQLISGSPSLTKV